MTSLRYLNVKKILLVFILFGLMVLALLYLIPDIV